MSEDEPIKTKMVLIENIKEKSKKSNKSKSNKSNKSKSKKSNKSKSNKSKSKKSKSKKSKSKKSKVKKQKKIRDPILIRTCNYCALTGDVNLFLNRRNTCKECSIYRLTKYHYTTSAERRKKVYDINKKYYSNLSPEKKKARLLRISQLRRERNKRKKLQNETINNVSLHTIN